MENSDSAFACSRACSTVIVQGWKSSASSSSQSANLVSHGRTELLKSFKVEPTSQRRTNTTDQLIVCICERYGRFRALLTPREVFWSRRHAPSGSGP
jgi:hypothetical protein